MERAASLSPDQLADAYTDLTADLAFAQTHFPTSRITIYLNNLASALHNEIYRNKREKWTRIITFWTQEVPRTMHDARRELLTSFLIFVASALIGVLSAANDPDFVRLILGNGYVDMTLDNIANGEPMAVYNGSSEVPMFLGITLNNVMVSFNCFAMGLLTSFGTGYMLLSNGIMVGAFQTFFYQHDLLWESSLAIWLHGTLEIWAIIVAGAAGLALGNGWLFPGTYSRLESFRRGAKRGLKIVIGTFIKENWKQLFKYSTYLILPICLIQAANFSGLMGSMTDLTAMQASGGISDNPLAALGPSFALNYAGVIFFSCLGALLMTSLVYAMVRLYNEREERLNGIVFGDIKSLLLRNIKRLFLMGIACSFLFIFAVVIVVLLAVLTPFTLILTIPLLFAFMVPLALMAPIYLFEDISLGEAFAKTFRLGFATWGGVFLVLMVMGLIASVLQGIVSIPWYVIYIVKMVFTMSDGGATSSSVGLNFAQYLFSILMLYGSYLSAIFSIVGLVYQYGHASEVVDSITVESDIDNFDKL